MRRLSGAVTGDLRRASRLTEEEFGRALQMLPEGFSTGAFAGRAWSVTVKRSDDGRRIWLFAEELGGRDIVSFNLYLCASGKALLKPCEMSSSKVMDFVIGFHPKA